MNEFLFPDDVIRGQTDLQAVADLPERVRPVHRPRLHRLSRPQVLVRVTRLGEFSPNRRCVYFRKFYKNYRSSPKVWAILLSIYCVLRLAKNWLGNVLGDLFTNASGHPGADDSVGGGGWYWHWDRGRDRFQLVIILTF
jgi:hypothetical protein